MTSETFATSESFTGGYTPDPTQAGTLAECLDEAEAWLERFVVFPSEHGPAAVALWAAATHAVADFDVAPYLLITAAEIESGKTRMMEVVARLVRSPLFSSSMTPAVLFRTIDREHPTLFLDEADNIWTGHKDEKAGELVALLNAGHRRGVPAYRMGGRNKTELETFDVFGPKAIAGAFPDVGKIPEALRSRSIHIRMQRKLPGETVERWTRQTREATAEYVAGLNERLADWVTNIELARVHIEPLPELSDRDFDIFEPLLAIAYRAGEGWPAKAHDAAIALTRTDPSQAIPLRIQVLRDLQEVWETDAPYMYSHELLERLCGMEDRIWNDFYGQPLSPHRLARFLTAYGIESHPIGESRRKGYYRQDLEDTWSRYTPQESFQTFQSFQEGQSETSETSETLLPGYDAETEQIAP